MCGLWFFASLFSLAAAFSLKPKVTGSPLVEVVGANGRIGSQILRLLDDKDAPCQAVPRGINPGSCSTIGVPIYIATPSHAWQALYEATPTERRRDLVFVGNGLPCFEDVTMVIPHYGILQVGAQPTQLPGAPPPPPTYCQGPWGQHVQQLLARDGIVVQTVDSPFELFFLSARKLLWSACLWLLCHEESEEVPKTVTQVSSTKLQRLAKELWTSFCQDYNHTLDEEKWVQTWTYLEQYSQSMPQAIPSKKLALTELKDRNGFFWKSDQTYHNQLLQKLGVSKEQVDCNPSIAAPSMSPARANIQIPWLQLSVSGTTASSRLVSKDTAMSVIIVGAGILGRSVALNLRRLDPHMDICLVDEHWPKVSHTTRASWAWINANQKEPASYRWMNQMGLLAWRRDELFSSWPRWTGSLVRVESPLPDKFRHGYAVEGPLSPERLLELEPKLQYPPLQSRKDSGPAMENNKHGYFYYFSSEGLVDPVITNEKLEEQIQARWIRGRVARLLRQEGTVCCGVECEDGTVLSASTVIVAAGAGCPDLVPEIRLRDSPGQIAFGPAGQDDESRLERILVDTVAESHILQRDGVLVAGGGYLQVGGSASGGPQPDGTAEMNSEDSSSLNRQLLLEKEIWRAGTSLMIKETTTAQGPTSVAAANRPMPLDGLPVVGWSRSGVYAAVCHSGVTLAPILSALVAMEIHAGVDLDLLESYRPRRFE